MDSKQVIGFWDYTVIAATLVASLAIGFKFRNTRKISNSEEYMLGGKNMSKFPVIMSISVTLLSAINMIGTPMEIYRYGFQLSLIAISMTIGIFLVTFIFVPVWFQCNVSSIYEFLELRYGKFIRHFVSGLFVIKMIFFMSVLLYAPALALSAVTNLSLEISIVALGLVCSVYSAIGGLKGVLWTDVFQAVLIFCCMTTLFVKSISEAGGLSVIIEKAMQRNMMNFNFKIDLVTRYTFWNTMFRGICSGVAYFGTDQMEVQRALSMSSSERAKSVLRWSCVPQVLFHFSCSVLGLIMYAIFSDCDPVSDKEHSGVFSYDQTVPYYIVTRFHSVPGLTGLCIAGLFSGSLSSLSSSINSLVTVTLVDFLKPACLRMRVVLTETRAVQIAKALSLLYGLVFVGFAYSLRSTDSLVAVAFTLVGATEGPVLVIFLMGVLTRRGTERNALIGLALGVGFTSWIAFGSLFSGYSEPALPLSTSGCASYSNMTIGNATALPTSASDDEIFFLYKVSFQWLTVIGFLSTTVFTFICILCSGWQYEAIPEGSKCLSPITRLWSNNQTCATLSDEQEYELETKISILNTD